ncbi:hypothetical protein EDB89DRAFT_2012062 [Lactarius sanguifluus]|nr:hypothetical protein EDB89DRAFT_2012062 [Lactarius sanguifluus]
MLRPCVRIFSRSKHVLILLSANMDLALHLAPAPVLLDRPAAAPELLQLHLPGGASCIDESLGPDVLVASSRVPRRRLGLLSGTNQWQGRQARWRERNCAPNVDAHWEIRTVSSFSD